jgi:voltage-gated potassium channel
LVVQCILASVFTAKSAGGQLIFVGLTVTFLKQFGLGISLTSPLLVSLAAVITLLGQAVGRKEGWSRFDSLYWSFITATTVGYGDLRPVKQRSRILAILIAFLGLVLSGIVIAVAVQAATLALRTTSR